MTARTLQRPARRRSRRRTPGVSLIETVAVMAASAVLVAAAATALVALGQADRRWSRHVDEVRQCEQLIHRLRRDIHEAQSVAWDGAAGALRLTMVDGGELIYRKRARRFERRLQRPDGEGGQSVESTSAYPVPAHTSWQATPLQAEAGDLVHVRFSVAPAISVGDKPEEGDAFELTAAVGRDGRLLHP